MSQPIIKLENIDFFYDKGKPAEVHALKNINIEINQGEFVSFFGSSGCGKSTMLYVISGIDRPEQGQVWINGHDLTKFSQQEIALYRQMGIGLIFQNFNLIPSISILDNVMLPMSFLGLAEHIRRKRAEQILEELGIKELKTRLPYELSGGQQQRVGIARALANDPPIIIADEPTGNLDSKNAVKILELLKDLSVKQGKTVILVTHEAWSLKYVDKIFYMKDGSVTNVEDTKKKPIALSEEGKGLSDKKNLEDHYAKVDASMSIHAMKAHTYAVFFLHGHSTEEIERAQSFITERFENKLSYDALMAALDRPFRQGGVGLWTQKARKIADSIEDIIREQGTLASVYDKLKKNPFASLADEIVGIRHWLLKDYGGVLSPFQTERFDEAISERLEKVITAENFKRVMSLPKKDGGVGFPVTTGLRITDRFEMLLAADNPENTSVKIQY